MINIFLEYDSFKNARECKTKVSFFNCLKYETHFVLWKHFFFTEIQNE